MLDRSKLSEQANKFLEEMNGFCIAYFQHEVLVGHWNNGAPVFNDNKLNRDNLLEAHIFNEISECRIVKISDEYKVRIIQDSKDKVEFYFDEDMLIIGSQSQRNLGNGFVKAEEHGRVIILPKDAEGKKIKIRNYLSFEKIYDDTLDADSNEEKLPISEVMRVTDWRYVGFVNEDSAEEVYMNA